MIETIVKFSRVLYEPLSVTVLVAIVLAFYLNWRKWDRLFWIIAGSIAFMIAWRLGIGIFSARYASILIYPTVILVAYLFYRVTELFPKIPYLCKIPGKYYPWISRGLLIGMLIPCVIKDFRFNHYAGFIPETCKIINADAANYQYPVILDLAGEATRLQYYSGLESHAAYNSTAPKNIERAVRPYRFLHDAIYVVVNERPGESIAFGGDGEWELISSKFKNNRKRLKFNVYRYAPSPEDKLRHKAGPEPWNASGIPVANGAFEKGSLVPPGDLYIRRFRNKNIPFFREANFLFPGDWSLIGAPGFEADCNGEVELSGNSIAGKYSLRMSAAARISVCHEEIHRAPSARLEFFVRGTPGSIFAVAVDAYDPDGGFLEFKTIGKFRIFSGDVYQYNIPVIPEDVSYFDKFRLYFVLEHGEIYLDHVSLRFGE
jgi:hypothetical protein